MANTNKLVQLSSGTFTIQANKTFAHALFRGQGQSATTMNVDASRTMQFGKDANLQDMLVVPAATHAGVCVKFLGEQGFIDRIGLLRGVLVRHTGMDSASFPAGSVLVQLLADTGDIYIDTCEFGPFGTRGGEVGFEIKTQSTAGHQAYIQGCRFNSPNFRQAVHAARISRANDYGGADGNRFNNAIIEAYNGHSIDGFTFDYVQKNHVDLQLSDWVGLASGAVIVAKNGGYYNSVIGQLYGSSGTYILDESGNTYTGRNFVLDTSIQRILASTKYESLMTGRADQWTTSGTTWISQTFTAESRHSVKFVRLYGMRNGSDTPGTITLSLKAVDGSHHPTGAALASATYAGTTMWNDNFRWFDMVIALPYELVAGTEYALEIKSAATGFILGSTGAVSAYSGGLLSRSTDSGSSWSEAATLNEDALFQIWDL